MLLISSLPRDLYKGLNLYSPNHILWDFYLLSDEQKVAKPYRLY